MTIIRAGVSAVCLIYAITLLSISGACWGIGFDTDAQFNRDLWTVGLSAFIGMAVMPRPSAILS